MSVWLVTGATRGFGRHIVDQLAARGHQVVAVARTATPGLWESENVLAVEADVTKPAEVQQAVDQAISSFGRIDFVINSAGRGLLGAIEEASPEEARGLFELNVFGVLNVIKAVLPTLRAQKSGTIVNISSLAGISGMASWGIYSATKFAVEGLSEALGNEVRDLGIRVLIVEPGIFRTTFLDEGSLEVSVDAIADYAATSGQARENLLTNRGAQRGDPAKAARLILDTVESGDFPSRIQLGEDAFNVAQRKTSLLQEELDAWRPSALVTDFEPQTGIRA